MTELTMIYRSGLRAPSIEQCRVAGIQPPFSIAYR